MEEIKLVASKTGNETLYTYDKAKQKYVHAGVIVGNRFRKNVTSTHFMVKHNGYGIQAIVLNELIKKKVDTIIITTSKGTTHTSKIIEWVKNGKVADYGNGKQYFLDVKLMQI
jgi:hypothetical protein